MKTFQKNIKFTKIFYILKLLKNKNNWKWVWNYKTKPLKNSLKSPPLVSQQKINNKMYCVKLYIGTQINYSNCTQHALSTQMFCLFCKLDDFCYGMMVLCRLSCHANGKKGTCWKVPFPIFLLLNEPCFADLFVLYRCAHGCVLRK